MGGLFGGDDNSGINEEIQAQIDSQKLQMEQQKDMLIASRLNLIKNQGREQWTADDTSLGSKTINRNTADKDWMNSKGGGFF